MEVYDFKNGVPSCEQLDMLSIACWQHAETSQFHEAQRVYDADGNRKFLQSYSIKVDLIHTEVSEITEDLRKNDLQHAREEIADAIIRLLDLDVEIVRDNKLPNSLSQIITEKMKYNLTRGVRHGGKAF